LLIQQRPASLSEVHSQAHGECSLVGIFLVKVERVQVVILTADVEQSDSQFRLVVKKSVAGERVKLPEIIIWQNWRVTGIALLIPQCFCPEEKIGWMIVDGE
jgi:hypothetical protein